MKLSYILFSTFLVFDLATVNSTLSGVVGKVTHQEIIKPDFQRIIDSAKVEGSILVYDIQKDVYYSNDFNWAKNGQLPASTFKIPNSIIALETAVVENEHTVFEWNGEKRALRSWEQDLVFRDAFQFSCVPCYQDVARQIGSKRMNEYLKKLKYGSIEVDSANIDMFWLLGDSRINQFEQIDFLKRFYNSELPISKRTENIMREVLVLDEYGKDKISGKTGWSVQNGINNGWFVGYVESENKIFYFATNVEPEEDFNMDLFPSIRKDVTFAALTSLGILEKGI